MRARTLPLKDALNVVSELSTSDVVMETKQGPEKSYGYLTAFLSDRLAYHGMADFKASFSPKVKHPCSKCCEAVTAKPQKLFCSLHLSADAQISEHVQALEAATSTLEISALSVEFGVNGRSLFCQVPYISLTRDVLLNPMHVFVESIVLREMVLEMVRERVLLLHLSLISRGNLQSDSAAVQYFLLLVKLTQILLSPVLTVASLIPLRSACPTITDSFECYSTVFIL